MITARRAAQDGVVAFHDAYNTNRFQYIYDTADPAYRRSTNAPAAAALLRGVQDVLGPANVTRSIGVNMSIESVGTLVILVQRTSFAHGVAKETFTFRVTNGVAALVAYRIDADELRNLGRLQRS